MRDIPTDALRVGFWGPGGFPALPDPRDHVDPSWDPDTRALVELYLEKPRFSVAYKGWSSCRICGVSNGSCDYSDGVYVWPSGYRHYLHDHQVRPPEAFIEHVLAEIKNPRPSPGGTLRQDLLDNLRSFLPEKS